MSQVQGRRRPSDGRAVPEHRRAVASRGRRAGHRGIARPGRDVAGERQPRDPGQPRPRRQRPVRRRRRCRRRGPEHPDRPGHLAIRPSREEPTVMTTVQTTTATDELTALELESMAVEPLPDRAAMSLVNANVAAPINAAVALNALSDGSVAYANAQQTAPITQSTGGTLP